MKNLLKTLNDTANGIGWIMMIFIGMILAFSFICWILGIPLNDH